MSSLASWQLWLWALNVSAEIGVCYLIVRRGAYKFLSLFFFYLVSDLAQSTVMFLAYKQSGFSSWTSYIVAWSAQGIVVMARGMAVAEVCKNSLSGYQGIWAFGWRIIAGVGIIVALYAGFSALLARHSVLWL